MNNKRQEQPFKNLGHRLKIIRQKQHESVAEVSGAVEIDETTLQRIEQGHERPTEDILMLLISHFGMREDEAANLWQLAGYDHAKGIDQGIGDDGKSMILIMAIDPRAMYSDKVQVNANSNGVVMSFSQNLGVAQPLTLARIGMSREQARIVLKVLQDALHYSEPKQLPSSSQEQKSPDQENRSK